MEANKNNLSNFITNNENKNLKDRIIQLVKNSEELKFLVAFFYFSGLKELYDSLRENEEVFMKVLVGLNVDKIDYKIVEYELNKG